SVLALAAVSLIGVLVGQVLYDFVPAYIVTIAAGVLFIAFGLATVLLPEKEGKEVDERKTSALGAFGGIFALMALMEMGDKTQLSVIALSAQYGAPLLVLLGAVAAFALVTLAGVMLGAEIGRRVPQRYIKLGSAAVFIIFGVVFLAQALIDIEPF
ncbi:MAG: TMEM165/GDT1 family protein, partial [Methanomassiliicoccales archaeon]|nr:TMEM165/GDT1 family protein [Methanomassiliicoccales archaeon]